MTYEDQSRNEKLEPEPLENLRELQEEVGPLNRFRGRRPAESSALVAMVKDDSSPHVDAAQMADQGRSNRHR
jgi:hypothetical protein